MHFLNHLYQHYIQMCLAAGPDDHQIPFQYSPQTPGLVLMGVFVGALVGEEM